MVLATSIYSKNTTACLYKTSSSDGMNLSSWQIACQLSQIFCSQSLPIRLRPSPLTTRSVHEASWSVYCMSWNVSHNTRRHLASELTRSKRKVKSRRWNVPITVSLRVNQVETTIEVDTRASVSIVSEATYRKLWSGKNFRLQPSNAKLCTYVRWESLPLPLLLQALAMWPSCCTGNK